MFVETKERENQMLMRCVETLYQYNILSYDQKKQIIRDIEDMPN